MKSLSVGFLFYYRFICMPGYEWYGMISEVKKKITPYTITTKEKFYQIKNKREIDKIHCYASVLKNTSQTIDGSGYHVHENYNVEIAT